MMKSISMSCLVLCFAMLSGCVSTSIKGLSAEDKGGILFYSRDFSNDIALVYFEKKKELEIRELNIKGELPTGPIKTSLREPYVVTVKTHETKKRDGRVYHEVEASDWFDGIGVTVKLEYWVEKNNDIPRGDANLTLQFEETTLSYSAQVLRAETKVMKKIKKDSMSNESEDDIDESELEEIEVGI